MKSATGAPEAESWALAVRLFRNLAGSPPRDAEAGGGRGLVERRPQLQYRREAMTRTRNRIRHAAVELIARVREATPADQGLYAAVCAAMRTLVVEVERLVKAETTLLQDALLRDDGGEG